MVGGPLAPGRARNAARQSSRQTHCTHSAGETNSLFPIDMPSSVRYYAAMLSKELVAASTVPLVLSVLAQGENYGYALIQRVRELSDGRIEWTEGMLYPVLHWMEEQKLIESEWREAETGRRRKYYRIRREGRTALSTERQQWLTVHQTLTRLWRIQPH